ncbi:MAG: HAD family hydrolase [Bacteroidaceae bacterium]|nr:HAD family hydrolase [Bacteroidaceae bacterium]
MRRAIGNGAANQLRKCAPEGTPEETIEQMLAIYKPYYTAHCQIKTKPYAGIPEALTELCSRYPVAIVSNKPDAAVKELCAKYFPGIYALGETPDCPRKPAPDMVFKAMNAIGVDRCVYVGDSEVDVLTAKNAAMPCLSVLWGFRDREDMAEAGAAHFCEIPNQIVETIEEMIHGK